MRVKNKSSEFLPLRLKLLLDDAFTNLKLSEIAKEYGLSKQALNYHVTLLRKTGLIKRVQSFPYSIYETTPLGERVKESLRQSETGRRTWKAHNRIVGYNIADFGSFRFVRNRHRKIVKMNNWNYAREQSGDSVINIQDTGLLKIYCPSLYTSDPDKAFGKMERDAQRIAQSYCDRYDMKLSLGRTIRKGHKSLVGSELLVKILGRGTYGKGIYADASPPLKREEMEEPEDSNEIENLLEMPKRLDNLENVLSSKLTPAIEELTNQINLHLDVLKDMKDTLKGIREEICRK